MADQKRTGRPSSYTQEIADELCAKLSDGVSLRTVCLADDMPSKTSVFRWLRTNEEFRDQYTRAKEESADALTDEMLDIADDGTNDWSKQQLGEDGPEIEVLNSEHIQRSRLRIETRKWLASKLKPKRYGDKTTTEHTGSLGLTDMSEETLDAKLAELLKSQ
jgi:hypothetical protein